MAGCEKDWVFSPLNRWEGSCWLWGTWDVTCWLHNVSSGSLCPAVPVPQRDGNRGGKNLNAAGAVAHRIFGQSRVYSFRWSFLQLQQCSSALSQVRNKKYIRNKLWTMFREEKRVHYDALDNLKPFLTSLMQSLARWLCLRARCCFYYVCFLFSPTTCLILQIILQQTFLSLKWP